VDPVLVPALNQYAVSKTWSLVFLNGDAYPSNRFESAWVHLLVSEPALYESSMAVGFRYWSPDASTQQKANWHWSRALNVIVERINSGQAFSDAVLAAVASMAFGERLMKNHLAWEIHMDGLSQLVKVRQEQGIRGLPRWFADLLIL
jgi:hypothetical protein